jgi:hypothetical protein
MPKTNSLIKTRQPGTFAEIQIIEKGVSLTVAIPEDLLEKFIRGYGNALRFTNSDSGHMFFAKVDSYHLEDSETMHVKVSVPEEHEKTLRSFIKKFGDQNGLGCKDLSNEFHRKIT